MSVRCSDESPEELAKRFKIGDAATAMNPCLADLTETVLETSNTVHTFFNIDDFMCRVGDDRTLARELVELFLPESTRLLDQIQKAACEIDRKALESAAHALKGSLGTLSATRAFEIAATLETIGKEGDMASALSTCNVLERELSLLYSELATFVRVAG